MGLGVHREPIAAGHVVDTLVRFPVLNPALDNLGPLQGHATDGIAQGPDQEPGRSPTVCWEIRPHRDALVIGFGSHPGIGEDRFFKVIASKKTNLHPRATGGEGFLPAKGVVNGIPGVLLGPDTRDPRGPPGFKGRQLQKIPALHILQHVRRAELDDGAHQEGCGHRTPLLRCAIQQAHLGKEIGLVIGNSPGVGITGAHETKFVGVAGALLLQRQTAQQAVPGVAARKGAGQGGGHPVGHDFEIGPLVGLGESRVGF